MTNIIIDLVIIATLALTAYLGYRKGFILTLCSFLAIFIALFGAVYLSNLLCEPVGRLIQPALESSIVQIFTKEAEQHNLPTSAISIDPAASGPGQEDMEPTINFNDALAVLKEVSFFSAFVESLQDTINTTVSQTLHGAARTIANHLAREIARVLLFAVCFLLVIILWTLISHILDLAFRLPVLSTINAAGGLALGLVKGVFIVWVLAWLISSVIPSEFTDTTILYRFFSKTNIFSWVLSFFTS